MQLSDEVIARASAGSIKDFEKVVNAYFKPVYKFVMRFTTDKEDIMDLVQESFIKVYLNFSRFNPDNKFSTWLFTIVKRTVYDWLRKKRRIGERTIKFNDENRFFQIPDKAYANNHFGEKIDVYTGLAQLESKYKYVLLLYYWEGYSYKEIAEILDKPINSVKTLLSRAKTKMKIKLHL